MNKCKVIKCKNDIYASWSDGYCESCYKECKENKERWKKIDSETEGEKDD